VKTADKI